MGDYDITFESAKLEIGIERIVSQPAIACFQSGELNDLIGKVRNRLYIIGAQPGMGKSTLLLQWAEEFAEQGHPVLFASLEMPRVELLRKSLSRLSNGKLPLDNFEAGNTDELAKAAKRYRDTIAENIMFLTEPITASTLSTYAGNMKKVRKGETPIIFVDYIQIMSPNSSHKFADERAAIKETAAKLRQIVNKKGCPVFAISSIRRTDYAKSSAGLDALAEAQALEYGADVVAFLTSPKKKETARCPHESMRDMTLSVVKNRYGRTGEIDLSFNPTFATFEVS